MFQVKKIAPEFYDDLPQHDSWSAVLYDFIMDPDVGPYARIKRKNRGLRSWVHLFVGFILYIYMFIIMFFQRFLKKCHTHMLYYLFF